MKVGMILLDPEDKYVYEDNSLPIRPKWDKEFITEMIRGKKVLCSMNVIDTIPRSMRKIADFTTDMSSDYDINWGIKTFVKIPDLLIVTRGKETKDIPGKVFRLNDFHRIYKDQKGIELWLSNL